MTVVHYFVNSIALIFIMPGTAYKGFIDSSDRCHPLETPREKYFLRLLIFYNIISLLSVWMMAGVGLLLLISYASTRVLCGRRHTMIGEICKMPLWVWEVTAMMWHTTFMLLLFHPQSMPQGGTLIMPQRITTYKQCPGTNWRATWWGIESWLCCQKGP